MNCINFLRLNLALIIISVVVFVPQNIHSQSILSFSQEFSPATIGSGSQSNLVFTITNNSSGTPAMDLAFSNTLPGGLTVGGAGSSTTCTDGIVSATPGSTSFSFSNGRLGAGSSCTVQVPVTGTVTGNADVTYTNTPGLLTSSNAGSAGSASADLTIATDRPGFSKAFSPSTISPGNVSRLTFTIDNSANGTALTSFSFSDELPGSLEVAFPSNAATTCDLGTSTIGATPGTSTITVNSFNTFSAVPANGSCTVSVDVTASDPGSLNNITSELFSTNFGSSISRSSGFASANITVLNEVLSKSFTDDPVSPGGSVNLRFTLKNLNDDQNSGRDNQGAYSAISFSDDLDAALSGLVATGLPVSACGGTLSSTNGGSTIDFTGGSLNAGESCTIDVSLSVPSSAPIGSHLNTTTSVNYDVGGNTVVGNTASDVLVVRADPVITKEFLDNPAVAGGTTRLEFNITNTSGSSTLSDIAFTDEFVSILKTASSVPTSVCNGGDLTFTPFVDPGIGGGSNQPARLILSGGSLGPGQTCTFEVTLDVVTDAFSASYPNTTSSVTGTINGQAVEGDPATDVLDIIGGPSISKEFPNSPVIPGGQTTLEFTISHDAAALDPAMNIAFTDDLNAALSGMTAVSTNSNGCGGTISGLGTGSFGYSGGSLSIGASCTISIEVDVPAGAAPGLYTNNTSTITADIGGASATGKAASADLFVTGLSLTKSFTNDPVDPGGTVTLQFTMTNAAGAPDATAIGFTDDIDQSLSGLTLVTPLNNGTCDGTVLSLSGNTFLQYTGGSLTGGSSCSFSVVLNVPANAAPDNYSNTTESFNASFGGSATALPNATDELVVAAPPSIVFEKSFDDAVAPEPGDNVTLSFTIGYDGSSNATGINFTDDLGATLTGLTATGLPASACGGTISGTGVLSFSGGSLTPGNTCSFDVDLVVPGSATAGDYNNTTSTIGATVNGQSISGSAASDILTVADPESREPIADAGTDQEVECLNNVVLDGSGSVSFHPGGITSYVWRENGQTVATGVNPTISLDIGVYIIELEVTDAFGTDVDLVEIIVFDEIPPTITCPPDVFICEGETPILGNPTVSDNCDPSPVVTNDAPATFTDPVTIVKWMVTDASGNMDSCYQTVTIADDDPPTAICKDITIELDANGTASITAADVDNGSSDACGDVTLSVSQTAFNCSHLGFNTVTLTVTDEDNNTATCQAQVEVKDVTPPTININPSVALIQVWPPNHKYNTFDIDDLVTSVSDNCDTGLSASDVTITSVSSDEPDNDPGTGDGDTDNDMVISGDCRSVDVRQERDGGGNGRVYTVNLEVTDASGNTGTASFLITVPISNNGSKAIDDGPSHTVSCGSSFKPDITKSSVSSLVVRPNPTEDIVIMNLSSFENGPISIEIYNIQGQRISDYHLTKDRSNLTELDLSQFENGTYFIMASQGSLVERARILKVK